MARRATGTIEWQEATSASPGHWKARIRLTDGTRPWVHYEDLQRRVEDEKEARARAKVDSETAKRRGVTMAPKDSPRPPKGSRETVSEYFKRIDKNRQAKGHTSTRSDRSRFEQHVEPTIGALFMDAVDRRDVERVRDDLDRKIERGELAWKTGANVWTLVTSIFREAHRGKRSEFRVREELGNPCADVAAPERGTKTAKTFLYPSELLQLVAAADVPAEWRCAYAIATYAYLRAGELAVLEWPDVDLDHRRINVTKALQADGTIGPPKNGRARAVPIEPVLVPLLEAMKREAKGEADKATGLVTKVTLAANAARVIRRHLEVAKITRRELFPAEGSTVKPLGFHDLRATGITWRAVRGDSLQIIREHAGHQDIATTDGYVRLAEGIRDGFGEVFPELPAAAFRTTVRTTNGARRSKVPGTADVSGCRRWDLNPHSLSGTRF